MLEPLERFDGFRPVKAMELLFLQISVFFQQTQLLHLNGPRVTLNKESGLSRKNMGASFCKLNYKTIKRKKYKSEIIRRGVAGKY